LEWNLHDYDYQENHGFKYMNVWKLNELSHESVKATYALAKRAAMTQASILIQGETGTGKEVLAQYIHQSSAKATGPWVAINCAAMPESMIEAILFGYEKGSFTSAVASYAGKFEQAHTGTLLLDEIGELPLSLQAKLLRVLQTHEVERLGAKQATHVDVRVIAATNQDLKQRVQQGLFRLDLFYRLNVITLVCTPLRDRGNDVIYLAKQFLMNFAESEGKPALTLTSDAEKKLLSYPWPGNIRELENTMQRALILDEDARIDANDISFQEGVILSQPTDFTEKTSLKAQENEIILNVLKEVNGVRGVAAKRLNISPRTLRHKLMKLKQIGCDIP
jgi:two-component system response regulator FlrC